MMKTLGRILWIALGLLSLWLAPIAVWPVIDMIDDDDE
jgi:hypothetical protein